MKVLKDFCPEIKAVNMAYMSLESFENCFSIYYFSLVLAVRQMQAIDDALNLMMCTYLHGVYSKHYSADHWYHHT